MSIVWAICPRCGGAPAPEGLRRKVQRVCPVCGNEFTGSLPDDGERPNYLAMRDALRPLASELHELWNGLVDQAEWALADTVLEVATAADDEGRMRWLRQEARYALGLDERPSVGLRGVMQEPEVAAMTELWAEHKAQVPAPAKPIRIAHVYNERKVYCEDHGGITVTDTPLKPDYRPWRCPQCGKPMSDTDPNDE